MARGKADEQKRRAPQIGLRGEKKNAGAENVPGKSKWKPYHRGPKSPSTVNRTTVPSVGNRTTIYISGGRAPVEAD